MDIPTMSTKYVARALHSTVACLTGEKEIPNECLLLQTDINLYYNNNTTT